MPKPRLHRSSRIYGRISSATVPPSNSGGSEPQSKRPRHAELSDDEGFEAKTLVDLNWPDDRGSVIVHPLLLQSSTV